MPSTSLEPVVQLRGIRIDNAPWADSARPFARLASAVAVVSWRSVAQRRPVIALLVLRDGEVDLERRADGLRNWRLSNPDYRGPGRYKVLALQAERATLRFLHGGIDLDLQGTASANAGADTSAAAPLPTRIELTGEWRRLRFKVSATTSPVLTFLETGRDFSLRGFLEAGGARLDVDGRAGDIARDPLIDARVTLAAPSLAPFAAFIEAHAHEAKAIRLEGALKAGDGRYALSAAKARVGATDLAGDASWTRGEPRAAVSAKLASDSTDLADLRWLAGLRPAVAPAAAPAAVAAAPHATGFSRGRDIDAEVSVVTRHLRAAEMPWLQSAQLDASLTDGQLTVSRFDVGIAQGHLAGKASVDVRDPPSRADVEVTLHGVRLEQLTHEPTGKARITGALHGRALLKASGDSAEALLASATGSVAASIVGGTVSSLLDAEIGLQGGKIIRSLLAGAEPLAILCAAAVLDVERGSARFRTLVLDTERTRTTGTGTIDLGHETIDVVLTPEAKQGGLFVLDRSIRLHGPLRQPARELVARAEAAAGEPTRGCASGRP